MNNRPKWVSSLIMYVSGTIMDDPSWAEDGSDDDVLDEVEQSVRDILCRHYGHEIEDDHCGIPEHRYCVWCGRRETSISEIEGEA